MSTEMLNDLELEDQIKDFSPAEQFLARQIYDVKKNCPACHNTKRQQIGIGGLSGIIGGAVVFAIEYLTTRSKSGG
ncbi:MAG: hypothetical protein WC560_10730 [Syntrophales bacterium]